jgi:ribonuclease P protein component
LTAKPFRLPRALRLQHTGEFRQVREKGCRMTRGCLIANWLVQPVGGQTRLGLVTSRRVGPAVVRNRARRLLREAFRLHRQELREPAWVVLVARPSIAGKMFAAVERDLLSILREARLLPPIP